MKSKRGVSISFPVIVFAILALIVLVLLAYFLIDWGSIFGRGIRECEGKGGVCVSAKSCEEAGYETELWKGCSINETYKKEYPCCLKVSKIET